MSLDYEIKWPTFRINLKQYKFKQKNQMIWGQNEEIDNVVGKACSHMSQWLHCSTLVLSLLVQGTRRGGGWGGITIGILFHVFTV